MNNGNNADNARDASDARHAAHADNRPRGARKASRSLFTLHPLRTWWRNRSLVDVHGWRVAVITKLPDSSVAMSPPMLEAIAALKLPWKVHDPESGIVFLLCPPGKCTIGSSSDEEGHKDDETLIACNIKHPFYLAETTTTQEQWERIIGANPSVHVGPKLPVENVSVNDCIAFTRACGPGFRFPHEVEWEYACRAGSDTPFSHANFLDADIVNYNGRYPYRDGHPDRIDGRLSTQAACPPTPGGFMRCTGMFGSGASPPPRVYRSHLRMAMPTYQLLCAAVHGRTTRTTAALHRGSREPRITRVKRPDFEWHGAFRTTTATAPAPPRRRSLCRYRLHASRCPQSALQRDRSRTGWNRRPIRHPE